MSPESRLNDKFFKKIAERLEARSPELGLRYAWEASVCPTRHPLDSG